MPRRRKDVAATDTMAPVSLRFTIRQMRWLTQESKTSGLPMTEIIRRALDAYREARPKALAA